MTQEARSVAAAYAFRFPGCWRLLLDIAAVVAVDEMSPQTVPDAIIPHLSHRTFERIYPMYSTPAMITTKSHTLKGLKNFITRIG